MPILLLIITHLVALLLGGYICNYYCKKNAKLNPGSLGLNSSALISNENTVELLGNYHDDLINKQINVNSDKTFMDAKLAWVSFADLSSYMHHIEFLSKKNGYLQVKNMGLRMYYGRYPTTPNKLKTFKNPLNTITDEVAGMHTLVMVPTYNNGETNIDFNPHYIENGNPTNLYDSIARLKKIRNSKAIQPKQTGEAILRTIDPINNTNATEPNTDINLNSFGLTPPRPNDNSAAAFIEP